MITFEITTDKELIQQVVTNPFLFRKLFADPQLNPQEWEPEADMTYLKILHNNKLMGLFPFKIKTALLAEVHIFILPKYMNKKLIFKAIRKGCEWIQAQYGIKKLTTWCPDNCEHIAKFLYMLNFTPRGHIPEATYYDQQLAGIIIWDTDIHQLTQLKV